MWAQSKQGDRCDGMSMLEVTSGGFQYPTKTENKVSAESEDGGGGTEEREYRKIASGQWVSRELEKCIVVVTGY